MRNTLSKLLLLLCLLTFATMGWSVINDYIFTQSNGTYTEISGGTAHGTSSNNEEVFNAVPIGFNFKYNGTVYNTISIATNGFIAMGPTVTIANNAISAGAANNVVVPLNRDLISRANGSLMSLLSGASPNRVFTIQWKNYRRTPTQCAGDSLNFQIQLYEHPAADTTNNIIKFAYGYFKAANFSTAGTVQCGLRGAANTEYINRATTTSWAATTSGLANNATCTMNNLIIPANGLIFTWAVGAGAPPPPDIISPANNGTNIAEVATLNWSQEGVVTGFKVYFGTDNPPTNIANGTIVTSTSYDPETDMAYSTVYYWKVVSFNLSGDAVNCPIWTFTTMPPPLVTEYPYFEYWDTTAVAPIVPPAWTTIDANNNGQTWTIVNSGAYSVPNAIRCSFSATVSKDDWFISPPLQLEANTNYRVRFQYKSQGSPFVEKLEVKYGTAKNVAAMTNQIFNNTNINNANYALGEAYISPTVSGVYYVGWHSYSAANMYYLFVDDISVSVFVPTFNPPQNLTATTGNGAVHLSWQPPTPTTRLLAGYKVYRNGALITPTVITSVTYNDVEAPIGTLCTYYIIASYSNPTGESIASNVESITPIYNPPANLTYTSTATAITLNWQAPAGSSPVGYKVYRDTILQTPNPITALTFVDNTATFGHTYAYYVTAIYTSPDGASLPSNTVNAQLSEPLTSPTGLTATVSSPNVILTWIAPAAPARSDIVNNSRYDRSLQGYKVYRNSILIFTINTPVEVTYTDANLMPNTYNYSVSAMYTTGDSPQTAQVPATVLTVFNPPVNLIATDAPASVVVTWSPPNPILGNLTGYRVLRDGIVLGHGLISGTTYTDNAVVNGVVYTYTAKAFYTNPAGESVLSNSDTGQGIFETLNPVTNLQYSVAQDNVSLTWTPPGGPILQDWISYNIPGLTVNGIGANGPANFDVAIRFTQTELTGIHNRYLTKVRYFPNEANCVYTIKVWTGGTSAVNPGNLTVELPITAPVIGAWNIVQLPTPIPIPSTGELWIGYNCNAQAGYPAGCDQGPSIPYKSNLIYTDNAWTILTQLNQDLDYNWDIQGFVVNFIGRESMITPATLTTKSSHNCSSNVSFSAKKNVNTEANSTLRNEDRSLLGYKIYRDGIPIAVISDYVVSNYTDSELANATYTYYVTAMYTGGESVPSNSVVVTVNVPFIPIILQDGFETYNDFDLTCGTWVLNDVDNIATTAIPGTTFLHSGSPMSYIVFNPTATTPAMTNLAAHAGSKMLASFGATTAANNDWLISPKIHLGVQNVITFWVKSYSAQNGLERYRVGLSPSASTTPASFTWLTGAAYMEAPLEWTQISYQIPNTYNATNVRLAIKCESVNGQIFLIDDLKIRGVNGYIVANEDNVAQVNATVLLGSYPNPFTAQTSITYDMKNDEQVTIEIYNQKGQKVKTLINSREKSGNHTVTWKGDDENGKPVSNGIYLYRMTSGTYSSSKKMILLK